MLAAGPVVAMPVAAQDDGPVIDAVVEADIEIEGGDAQGGDAQGGDAGLSAVINETGGESEASEAIEVGDDGNVIAATDSYVEAGEGEDGGNVIAATDSFVEAGEGGALGSEPEVGEEEPAAAATINQTVGVLEGGDAVGGDARGGAGLDAFVDAEVVLDAEIGVDLTAEVDVTADTAVQAANAVPEDLGGARVAAQPVGDRGGERVSSAQPVNPNSIVSDLGGVLAEPVGAVTESLSGLNLLDLDADLDLEIAGGDAAGGDAGGGNAVVAAVINETASGAATINQSGSEIVAGDATGGRAVGGDGIELDVILDADIDLIVDAAVDVSADIATTADAEVNGAAR